MHVKDTFVTNVPLCPLAPNPNGCYTPLYPIPIGYPGRSTYSSCGSRCPIPVVLSKRAKPKEIYSSAFYFLCPPMKREEIVAEMEMRGQWDLFIHSNLRLTCIWTKTQDLQIERCKCSPSRMVLTGMPCAWHLDLLARWWLVLVNLC